MWDRLKTCPTTTTTEEYMFFVRCAFCHKPVFRLWYPWHRQQHTRPLKDGQMTDHVTVHPEGRYQGSLKKVPRVYLHRRCRGQTVMPEEIVRSYLVNPFLYNDYTFCCGCNDYIHHDELVWVETGQRLGEYFDELKEEYIEEYGEPPPRPHI
jgi:hypothetical protein